MWKPLIDRLTLLERRVENLERQTEALRVEMEEEGPTEAASGDDAVLDESRSEQALRRLVRRMAPLPLRRVYEFKINLTDTFWLKRLGVTSEEMAYVREQGKRLISLTIEEWTGHRIAIAKMVPWSGSSQPIDHITRIYPTQTDGYADYYVLWDLPLSEDATSVTSFAGPSPRLVLRYEEEALHLFVIHGRFDSGTVPYRVDPRPENVLLTLPLDGNQLQPFKLPDDDPKSHEPWHCYRATAALTCYVGSETTLGIFWELWIHDLEQLRDPDRSTDD